MIELVDVIFKFVLLERLLHKVISIVEVLCLLSIASPNIFQFHLENIVQVLTNMFCNRYSFLRFNRLFKLHLGHCFLLYLLDHIQLRDHQLIKHQLIFKPCSAWSLILLLSLIILRIEKGLDHITQTVDSQKRNLIINIEFIYLSILKWLLRQISILVNHQLEE